MCGATAPRPPCGPISPHWTIVLATLTGRTKYKYSRARPTVATSPSGSSSPRPPCYSCIRKRLENFSTAVLTGLRSLTVTPDHKIIWKLFRLKVSRIHSAHCTLAMERSHELGGSTIRLIIRRHPTEAAQVLLLRTGVRLRCSNSH